MPDMTNETERDESLSRLLAQWTPPSVPETLDARVLASYRRRVAHVPFWRRLLSTSIRVPLPVAVAALVILLVAAAVALRRPSANRPDEPQLTRAAGGARTASVGDQPVVTRTSLAGFEPVAEMNVTVVQGDRKR
jgi:hypothetical protein